MANNSKVKRGFCELWQTTAARAIKNTTIIVKRNSSTCHVKEKYKSTSPCKMKYKSNSRKGSGSGSKSSSSSRSLRLFHFTFYTPHSIMAFLTTTLSSCLRDVHSLGWSACHQGQQQPLQHHKLRNQTSKNAAISSTFPATARLQNGSVSSSMKSYFFLWLFLSILAPCISLTMTEVRIPKHIMRYETAALGCKYDLDGESLYSVKWYKDGFEFYRYVPRDMPPGQVFPLPGVDVDLQNSTDNVVVLNRVTLQSTGRYRCEVSGEAPSFQTVSGHEDMIVVVTPLKGPQITGGQPRYSIGEKVSVNCTSAPSKPICHLSWLINGVHANRSYLRYYEPKIVGREGLEVATLGLEFRVRG